jgi:2-(1,2-epoxy-1,2-dihydrophenyl)acetyl-CoA isomerase
MRCSKPVVCAIDGPATGLGAELALECDVSLVTSRARFGWGFVQLGLVPDTGAGTWLLPRTVGVSLTLELLLTGQWLGAERAVAIGLASEVVGSDELAARASSLARACGSGSPIASSQIKRLVREGLETSHEAHLIASRRALEQCFASEYHEEAVAAFLERRVPRFTGR